ncbi:hypothetical protein BB558_005972 [Smittium angustum]|uniref:Major facilitator superfamily (MFS) profile domain-containing protein n=1 Tax=Smittium angustum TaxID=133377 RepID=A0A2U1IYY9_SMIAN|nr:hypothetical protein BB558_005972 [Smittium angustum]
MDKNEPGDLPTEASADTKRGHKSKRSLHFSLPKFFKKHSDTEKMAKIAESQTQSTSDTKGKFKKIHKTETLPAPTDTETKVKTETTETAKEEKSIRRTSSYSQNIEKHIPDLYRPKPTGRGKKSTQKSDQNVEPQLQQKQNVEVGALGPDTYISSTEKSTKESRKRKSDIFITETENKEVLEERSPKIPEVSKIFPMEISYSDSNPSLNSEEIESKKFITVGKSGKKISSPDGKSIPRTPFIDTSIAEQSPLKYTNEQIKEDFRRAEDPIGLDNLFMDIASIKRSSIVRRPPKGSKGVVVPLKSLEIARPKSEIINNNEVSIKIVESTPQEDRDIASSKQKIKESFSEASTSSAIGGVRGIQSSTSAGMNGDNIKEKFSKTDEKSLIETSSSKKTFVENFKGKISKTFGFDESRGLGLNLENNEIKYKDLDKKDGYKIILWAFLIHFFATSSMGLLYIYYKTRIRMQELDQKLNLYFEKTDFMSSLMIIGATALLSMSIGGIFSGYLSYKTSYSFSSFLGTIIMSSSLILGSLFDSTVGLIMFQGVIFGFGLAFSFFPAYTIPCQWFNKKIGLATGISISGAGVGYFVFSYAFRSVIYGVGVKATMQLQALLILVVCGPASMGLKTHYLKNKTYKFFEKKILTDNRFISLFIVSTLTIFGQYAISISVSNWIVVNNFSRGSEVWMVRILNLGTAAGAIAGGYVFDKYGSLGFMSVPLIVSGFFTIITWSFAKSFAVFGIYMSLLGICNGSFAAVVPFSIKHMFGGIYIQAVLGFSMFTSSFISNTIVPANIPPENEIARLRKESILWMIFGGIALVSAGVISLFLPRLHKDFMEKRKLKKLTKLYGDIQIVEHT